MITHTLVIFYIHTIAIKNYCFRIDIYYVFLSFFFKGVTTGITTQKTYAVIKSEVEGDLLLFIICIILLVCI